MPKPRQIFFLRALSVESGNERKTSYTYVQTKHQKANKGHGGTSPRFLSLIRVKMRGNLCAELYLPVGDMVRRKTYVVILQRKLQQNPNYLMCIDVSQ